MSGLTVTQTDRNKIDAEAARELCESVIREHSTGSTFSAANILRDHPHLNQFATVVVDIAYEEFCRRLERGELVDPKSFAESFPGISNQLYRQLLFHLAVAGDDARPPNACPDWPSVPSRYLHFDLIQQLGEGGASRVYLAADHRMEMRARVLKLSRSSRREAKSLAKLSHPSIIDALYCESDLVSGFELLCLPLQGRWTLQQVIQLLKQHADLREAADLWKLLAEKDDTPEWVRQSRGYDAYRTDGRQLSELYVAWARGILEGLAHAHDRGFLHCDVKPSNILIGWNGQAILLDFDASLSRDMLAPSCGGTLAYMAPEQLELLSASHDLQKLRLEPATDLYGWAMTFYELLSLESLFTVSESPDDLQQAIQFQLTARQELAIDWRRCGRNGPTELIWSLMACTQYELANRSQSADAVRQKLLQFDKPWRILQRKIRRHPAVAISIAAMIIVVGVTLNAVLRTSPEQDTETGRRALASNDLVSAYQYLSRAVARKPQLDHARVGLVRVLLRQQQYDDAIRQLDKLQESDWSRRCRAYALLASGREYKTAVNILKGFIDSGRATPVDYNNAAFGLRMSKNLDDVEQADSWLTTAIEIDPSYMTAWANRLVVEQRLSIRTGVIRNDIVNQAAERGHDSVAVLSELAMIWAVRGRNAERKKDHAALEAAEHEAIDFLRAAGARGIDNSHLHDIEVIWPRLAIHVAEIRSQINRKITEYRFLTNPAFDD